MNSKIKFIFAFFLVALLASSGLRPAFAMDDHLHVLIDIKPGSYPNAINLESPGMLPVALLGNSDFSVSSVDTDMVKFGRMHEFDSGASPVHFASKDVNSDGFIDIVFHFKIQETGLTSSDAEACLHGMLLDGTHFCGHDSIKIVP